MPANPTGVLLVGGGPSSDNVKADALLTGFRDREVVAIVGEAGINTADVAVMSVWACQPPDLRKPKDEKQATDCCKPLVLKAMENIPATVPILGMGQWAMYMLTGKRAGLHKARGFLYPSFVMPGVKP